MEIIRKYFPDLPTDQADRLATLESIYAEKNSEVNLVSRRDITNLYLHHVLPALALGLIAGFAADDNVLDIGTGGGLPGIPLAIQNPETSFHLIDSTGKKIRAVQGIITRLGLTNVSAEQIRSNELKQRYTAVVGRAVADIPDFYKLAKKNLARDGKGIYYITGGELELPAHLKSGTLVQHLDEYFNEAYFCDKKIIHIPNT